MAFLRTKQASKRPRFRYNFNFYHQPVFVQVVYKLLQLHIDKYARLAKDGTITYTRKDSPKTVRTQPVAESKRIFEDLYGEVSC